MAMITADPKDVPQVASFAFTPEYMAKVQELIAHYPPGRQASAVIGVLDLAQRQQGWLPRVAMNEVARILDMAPIRVYEIATFYTMFNLSPVGENFVQLCGTTPCWCPTPRFASFPKRRTLRRQARGAGASPARWCRVAAGAAAMMAATARPRSMQVGSIPSMWSMPKAIPSRSA